jgi:hypothetical protein
MVTVMTQKTISARMLARTGCAAIAMLFITGCSRQVADLEALFSPPVAVAPTRIPIVYRGPIYCYDSIGDPHCYAEPFPRAAERFIGAAVTPGDFPGTDDNGSEGSNTVTSN